MNNIIKAIELDESNPNSFNDFIGLVQSVMRPKITLFQDKIQHSLLDKSKHPTLYIVAYVDYHPSKRVLVDNRSKINIISFVELKRLKVPIKFLNTPTLTIRDFNNTLPTTMGIMVLLVRVRV